MEQEPNGTPGELAASQEKGIQSPGKNQKNTCLEVVLTWGPNLQHNVQELSSSLESSPKE